MNQFTEAHLNNWKSDYLKLTNSNQRYKLIEDNVWSLGDRIGIICIFQEDEICYITHCNSIYKTLKNIINVNKNNELIKLILIHNLGINESRIKSSSLSKSKINKIKRIVKQFDFSIISIESNHIEKVSNAFKVVADPIYNGHTSNLNRILDELPKKN
ncbi:MAG: hypothetical protein MK083_06230 [Dehalococcoidia bacterium]|nr:hypothetical protein [Dehalococcoidia bacterium]